MNSEKLRLAMAHELNTWGKEIYFIRQVKRAILINPEICIIACRNKKKTEAMLTDANIPKDRYKLVDFPEQSCELKEAVFDELTKVEK